MRLFISLAAMLLAGQMAWGQAAEAPEDAKTGSFPRYYDNENDPEDGSSDHPYQIRTTEDLNTLSADVNNGTPFKDKVFCLTSDLTYDGTANNFTPIGNGGEDEGGKPFEGTFDGGGHTISGINVDLPEGYGVGLFGYIHSYAVIKNLKLADCFFTGNMAVGGIVGNGEGNSDNFRIQQCEVGSSCTVAAVAMTIKGEEYLGKFAGGIIGYQESLTVADCTSAAKVSGDESVGGITGHLSASGSGGSIEDCIYTGSRSDISGGHLIIGTRGEDGNDDGNIDDDTKGTIRISLANAADNTALLDAYSGMTDIDVTLKDRTLYKDGSWNTLCLPFGIATIAGSTLDGAKVMTLDNSSFSDGTLTLNFSEASEIVAGKPYLIRWDKGSDLVAPVFSNVDISADGASTVTTTNASLVGTYSPVLLPQNDKTNLYIGADNKLYYPTAADFHVNACRAYLKLRLDATGESASPQQSAVRAFVLNFGDGEQTAIKEMVNDKSSKGKSDGAWFTLDGRRLTHKPSARGVYTQRGRKVVVK